MGGSRKLSKPWENYMCVDPSYEYCMCVSVMHFQSVAISMAGLCVLDRHGDLCDTFTKTGGCQAGGCRASESCQNDLPRAGAKLIVSEHDCGYLSADRYLHLVCVFVCLRASCPIVKDPNWGAGVSCFEWSINLALFGVISPTSYTAVLLHDEENMAP